MVKDEKVVVVGISGASGVRYSIDFCLLLRKLDYTPIVVLTNGAKIVATMESNFLLESHMRQFGIRCYNEDDLGASIASGSFKTEGMVIYPCSITSLSKIAYSDNSNLLRRAADVTIKERRKLILVVRETPLHVGHLRLMERVCEMGGIIMPLMFSYYQGKSAKDLTLKACFKQFNGRILDQLGIKNDVVERWTG